MLCLGKHEDVLYCDWENMETFWDRYEYTTFDPSKVAGGTRTSCVSPSPPPVHTPPPSIRAILIETPDSVMISPWAMRNCPWAMRNCSWAMRNCSSRRNLFTWAERLQDAKLDMLSYTMCSLPLPMLDKNVRETIFSLLVKKSRKCFS